MCVTASRNDSKSFGPGSNPGGATKLYVICYMKKYCKEEILSVENIPGIYLIRNVVNGKCYIGQSIYLKKRLLKHITLSDRKMHNTPLYEDIQKYGINSFEFDILKVLNTNNFKEAKIQLDVWEKEYIIKYNSYGDSGYNQNFEGDSSIQSCKFTEEQNQNDIIKDQESKKLDLLYVYLINGPQECKYITSMDITTLNEALRYHKFKEIDPSDLINAKQDNSIYGLYILASSREELEDKIKKYNNDIIENVK